MATKEYDDWEDDSPLIPISQLAGLQEISLYTDSSARAVWNWTQRYDFPEPITRVSNRPVWDMREIRAWFRAQKISKNGWLLGTRMGPNKPKES